VTSTHTDLWGVPVQAANNEAVVRFNDAVEGLVSLSGDPVALVNSAFTADSDLPLGHILHAYLSLYGTSSEGVDEAAKQLLILEGLDAQMDERELLHLRAARCWASGEWEGAARWLERALLHNPRDLMALKVAQDLYFYLGNRLDLRDVAARVLPAWPPDRPGWGYVQGIYAFGLEENFDYRRAEESARLALDHNPRDVWAVHALAHVFEMEGRQDEGVDFLTRSRDDWSTSYFAIHNWWHRALFHLELGELDQVVALYEAPIRAIRSTEWLDVVDAAALLWRLSLVGTDVSAQAAQLARDIEPLLSEPVYLFNDWHAVMVFGLIGREDINQQLLSNNRRRSVGTNRDVAERVGLDLLDGFSAFASGHPDRTIDRLRDIRPSAHAVGGSHAQRDIIDLTLIAASARAGERQLTEALVAERVARKPSAARAVEQVVESNSH
jgi:tetratricopeptide (TPR) repeat protein